MSGRRLRAGLLLALVAGLSLAAYLYYFEWAAPRLEADRIESFAYGPRESRLRELVIHERAQEGELLDRLIALVNEASLSSERPAGDTGFVVILLRDDGLQYRLLPADRGASGERGLVGLGEGAADFRGYLVSPELAREIAALEARGDGLRPRE